MLWAWGSTVIPELERQSCQRVFAGNEGHCMNTGKGDIAKPISEAGLLYALRELSRRAGVSFDFFAQWSISLRGDELIVRPVPDAPGTIHFPLYSGEERSRNRIVRKTWGSLVPAQTGERIPDFIVPFCREDSINGEALFAPQGRYEFRCTEDLLSSILLTLSRFEEFDSNIIDLHGRFPASAGIAARNEFLNRPIVDEYGLALKEILQVLIPRWQPLPKKLRVKISHDIDEIGIPFSFRSAIGHALIRGAPVSCARDFLSMVSDVAPGYLHAVRRVCQLSLKYDLRPTLYWQAAATDPFDTGYDVSHPKIAWMMRWANELGLEQGVHPGYETFRSSVLLKKEVERVTAALGKKEVGGRQHYLRWHPETWIDWEGCGLAYDSSVGFVDQAGFRCGTCVPYLPWLLESDRCANLMEIPLVAADGTLVQHMGLTVEQSRQLVQDLLEKCRHVGGVFTLLWHNTGMFPPCRDYYLPILELLRGVQDYEWEPELSQLRRERQAFADGAVYIRKESGVVAG
jgi:hypothetical protein